MTVEITLKDADGEPLQALGNLFYYENAEVREVATETDANGCLAFGDVAGCLELRIAIFRGGFWTLRLDAGQLPKVLTCPPLPSCQGTMWWHKVLGIEKVDAAAGKGIRIGVIDAPFMPISGLEHVAMLDIFGNPIYPDIGTLPSHGEVVCRLIGQRTSSLERFGGIAPGAELICIGAEAGGGLLNPVEVASAIVRLARDFNCDLINLSAGRRQPTSGIHKAICEAREFGALCVVAAGNEPYDQISFPARYPECVGVGAIGLKDWGPDGSYVRYMSDVARDSAGLNGKAADHDIFHYPSSAYGEGLDVVAPGVGLLIHRGAEPLLDVAGTSFAAPLVTGLLALILAKSEAYQWLARSPERPLTALSLLQSACCRTGIHVEREGLGLPTLRSQL
jgi:subtilisin family serine protease